LAYFARRCGPAIDPEELLTEVWGCGNELGGTRDQVKCCIRRLRKKIERDPNRPEYLVSVNGSGYLLRNQEQWSQARLAEVLPTDTDLTPL
jgi:DNA-binding response OmpR family regulator